jgi:hypothetical protein
MPPTEYLVANQFFGLGKESVFNTPVVPGFWIPISDPKWEPKLKWQTDEGMRGSPVDNYDQVPLVEYNQFSFKTSVYPDSFPNLMMALLGGTDTVTGTASPWTHTIPLLNSASTGSQPPSYTLDWFDGLQTRQIPGSRIASMTLTFGADVALECTPSFIGMLETDVSLPTNTPTTTHLGPGWDMSMLIGTVQVLTVVSGELTFERNTEALFTATGTQGPRNIFAGPFGVKGKGKFVIETGTSSAYIASALTRSQQVVSLVFTEPVSGFTQTFQISATQFQNPVLDSTSKKWLQLDCDFSMVADTTDASSGYSPLKFITATGQSAAY